MFKMPRPLLSHHDRKRGIEKRTSGEKFGTPAAEGGSESAGSERELEAFGFN